MVTDFEIFGPEVAYKVNVCGFGFCSDIVDSNVLKDRPVNVAAAIPLHDVGFPGLDAGKIIREIESQRAVFKQRGREFLHYRSFQRRASEVAERERQAKRVPRAVFVELVAVEEAEEVIILELVTITDCSISYLVAQKSSMFHRFAQQPPGHILCRIPHGGKQPVMWDSSC